MKRLTIALAGLALLALLAAPAAAKGLTLTKVRGDLTAADDGSDAKGKFLLVAALSGDASRERLVVVAKKLDPDAEHEVLVGDDLDGAVSFGEMRVRGRGYGLFRFRSGHDEYPDGVDALTDLGGQNLYVTADGEVLLEAGIPSFADPSGGDEAAAGAMAFGFGREILSPPEDSDDDAGGRVYAVALNSNRWGARERIDVYAWLLDSDEEYDVHVVEDDGSETKIGTLAPRTRFGIARLALDTKHDDELPAHLSAMEGWTVEVRNADGDAVLSGEFPALR